MSKYQNSKIYKIVCNNSGRIYIGSTYLTLEERLKKHELDYKHYLIGKCKYPHIRSFDIFKDKNYSIELIKNFPCKNRTELEREEGLHQREAHYNDDIDCVNKVILGRTGKEYHKEWSENNKEKLKIYKKEYYENNKDYLRGKHKEWHKNNKERLSKKNNCECGGKYTNFHKKTHFKTKKHQNYLASLSSSSSSSFQSIGRK